VLFEHLPDDRIFELEPRVREAAIVPDAAARALQPFGPLNGPCRDEIRRFREVS
jgi:hypothetical protein